MTDNFRYTPATGGSIALTEHQDEGLERLHREIAELRESRARLVRAADADRRGVERELHRGVQQDLVALAVNLELAAQLVDKDPGAARALLEEMRRDAQRAIEQTAELAQRISPPLLDAGGLVVALRSTFANAGVPVTLDVPTGACATDVAETVYRCSLSALAKAAPGAHATVSLQVERDAAVFEISIDGGSADGELAPLRDRVEALGGVLTIATESGGVRLSGSLPVSR